MLSREFQTMTCVLCGRTLPWHECFPDTTSAECWRCCWEAHIRNSHKRQIRKVRRTVRRRARRIKERELVAAMTERERQLILGPTTHPTTVGTDAADSTKESLR